MIFNDDYDASLWCIVKGDKKNRKQLVQFLRELPEELIWKIRETLAKADRYELEEVVIDANVFQIAPVRYGEFRVVEVVDLRIWFSQR